MEKFENNSKVEILDGDKVIGEVTVIRSSENTLVVKNKLANEESEFRFIEKFWYLIYEGLGGEKCHNKKFPYSLRVTT